MFDINTLEFPDDINKSTIPEQQFIVHIRAQQRTEKKMITIIEGLPANFNYKQFVKLVKQTFGTNAAVYYTDNNKKSLSQNELNKQDKPKVAQFLGDLRNEIKSLMINQGICDKSQIIVHGIAGDRNA